MTRLLVAGLLLAALGVARSSRSDVVALPDMPPQRLDASEAAVLQGHRRTTTVTAGETVIGFVLHPEPTAYAGAYLLDPRAASFEEVGAWRGELVGPCSSGAACEDGVATLIRLVAAAYARRSGLVDAAPTPAPTAEVVTVPTPVDQPGTTSQPDGAASATPALEPTPAAVAPSGPPPGARPVAPPIPPPSLLSVEGLLDLAARLRTQHPVGTVVALVALVLLWLVVRTPKRRMPPGQRVVITHEEHERAAARLQERLLRDKAKLERLNSEVEAEESKFISRLADLSRRL